METPKFISSIIADPPAWLRSVDRDGIVVSSRIRLARNLKEWKFPELLDENGRDGVRDLIEKALEGSDSLNRPVSVNMEHLSELSRKILFERHLISREHMQRGLGSGLVTRRDEGLSVMINEEDHLRLQSFAAGPDLAAAWKKIDALDSELGGSVDYAFSGQIGYLTCCPTNVGTGMRASVMLHLPALVVLNEIGPVVNGLSKIGLMVRGIWGEGSEIAGHMFQVSNQVTLGKHEVEIIEHLGHIVAELAEHELNARARLFGKNMVVVQDSVGRSRGILENAHLINSKEAMEHLSFLRFGIGTDIIGDLNREDVDRLFLTVQPAHLQMQSGTMLDDRRRDELRAKLIKDVLVNRHKEKGDNNE